MKHFHDEETDLLAKTSPKALAIIAVVSIVLGFFASNALALDLTKADLQDCQTIKTQVVNNGTIESDSVDEYTINLSKDEAIAKALQTSKDKNASFYKNGNYCEISINVN